MKKPIYSIPKLCKAKSGWYVHLRYNGVQKRYKFKLNYITDLQEREREFNMLKRALHQKLKDGWNPLVPEVEELGDHMTLTKALSFCLENKTESLKPRSLTAYRGTVHLIKKTIRILELEFLSIKEVKRAHIRLIIDTATKTFKWSNKARNKHLNYLSAILSELIEWDIIENNPAHKISMLPVTESTYNKTSSDDEHLLIKQSLSEHHPDYYNYIRTLYHTGARPFEILSIRLSMINLNNREINLPPVITKGGVRHRDIIINDYLMAIFKDMEILKYPEDFYLFGSYRQIGKGNIGKHLDFIPGPTPIKRDTATRRWKNIVKDGLGINITQYSYKHRGGDDKLIAGVDFDSIREQFGHSSKKMSRTYVKKIKGVYKKDIIENSPDF